MEMPLESEIIFYSGKEGNKKIDVFFHEETSWLSQKKLAEVFDVDVRTVNEHIKSIYKSEELQEDQTIRNFRIVQKEGSRNVNREIDFYNYLNFAENMAKRNKLIKMQDWIGRLDSFLKLNEYEILKNAGNISNEIEKNLAENEFEKFRLTQDREFISDFDKVAEKVLENKNGT